MRANEVAAAIHADMCNDDRNGYSWSPRWGGDHPDGAKTLVLDGKSYTYALGSWDCSSSAINSWQLALGCHLGCSTTHDMKAAFLATGKFEWRDMSFIADTGDLYLDEQNHVAMCQTQYPDILSEFSINENGDVYNGQVGDQTGWEASVHGYYDFAQGILHYIGNDEGTGSGDAYIPPNPSVPVPEVRFRVKTENGWLAEGASGDGTKLKGVAIDFGGNGWYQVCVRKPDGAATWVEKVRGYDVSDDENGYAGWNDYDVIAIRAYYETPNPAETGYFTAKYRAADCGREWWDWQYDDDTWNGQDGYAGDMNPLDRFEVGLTR